MLDRTHNQAAGLLGLALPPCGRLLGFVGHGDERAELPLLWRLCQTMVSLGYSVTVLDGTSWESEDNPGLLQRLEQRYWPTDNGLDAPSWKLAPSAAGLECLQDHRGIASARRTLEESLPTTGVTVLYASAQTLSNIFPRSGLRPILAVSADGESSLTGYLALKRLLLQGQMEPMLVQLIRPGAPKKMAPDAPSTVCACAEKFLNYQVVTNSLTLTPDDDAIDAQLQGLVLRMLENALVIAPNTPSRANSQSLLGLDTFSMRGH